MSGALLPRKSVIVEQIERARSCANALEKFERKHWAFLQSCPPDTASSMMKPPWLSFPEKAAPALARYFGNYGWLQIAESREKKIDDVCVSVYCGGQEKAVTTLLSHLDCVGPMGGVTGLGQANTETFGGQSLN